MFNPKIKTIIIPNTPEIEYIPQFLDLEKSYIYLEKIYEEIEFKSHVYNFYDKPIETKRKMSYHSDYDYSYEREVHKGKPWSNILIELKNKISEATGYEFNAVLANLYENGDAGMGWHADKEQELGKEPIIASLSLGQTRRFGFRHRVDVVHQKNPPTICEYSLASGDLLIMKGSTQSFFEHCIIKEKVAKEKRINLTFRKVIV